MGLMLSIFRQLLRQLFSQIKLQLMTILSLSVSLSILALFLVLIFNIQQGTQSWQQQSQIFVLLKSITADEIKDFEKEISQWDNIKHIQIYTSADAVKNIEALLGKSISGEMDALKDEQFFNPSLEIDLQKNGAIEVISIKEKLKKDPRVDLVKITEQDSFILKSIQELKGILSLVLWFVGIWVTGSISFMVYQLVRLNLYSRRQEIEVLNSVGAQNFFIQIPLALESAIQVTIANLIAMGMIELLLKNLQISIDQQPFAFHLSRFHDFPRWLLIIYFVFHLLIAITASLMSSRHFLKQRINGQI